MTENNKNMRLELVALDLHCDRLGCFIAGQMHGQTIPKPILEEDKISTNSVFDWLRVAASIESVSVNTIKFGEGAHYDSGILNYESARSDLLAELLMDQLRFSFVWGAFESLAKILNPPLVPKNVKERCSMVDRVAYLLRNSFDQRNYLLWGYKHLLSDLRTSTVKEDKFYLAKYFTLTTCVGFSGLAINAIRRIRNQFVHGIVNLPEPMLEPESDRWNSMLPTEPLIIKISTRLVLLTMQMMLLANDLTLYCKKRYTTNVEHVSLGCDYDWHVLAVLHLLPDQKNKILLFDTSITIYCINIT